MLSSTNGWAGSGETLKLLVLGDSLAAGYGLAKTDSFTTKLGRALTTKGHRVRIINAGVSGDTSAGGLARLAWALADKPEAVIVELGANDGLRGIEPAETRANLDAILGRLKQASARVLLAGMLAPPNLGREYGAEFQTLYAELAKKHQVALYPFFLEGVAADPALNQEDGNHPNPAGVDEIVRRILPMVETLLRPKGQTP